MPTNTILLAEDEPNDVFLIKRAFQKAGFKSSVQVAEDGDVVVAYLSGQGQFSNREEYPLPVLMLLDLKLPRRSGLEVLMWLKQQPNLKRLPVIVLTSSSETSDINEAYDLGANSFLVKPVSFQTLVDMIKAIDLYWITLNKKPRITDSITN